MIGSLLPQAHINSIANDITKKIKEDLTPLITKEFVKIEDEFKAETKYINDLEAKINKLEARIDQLEKEKKGELSCTSTQKSD